MLNCPLCTKTFIYPSILDIHMVTHTKEKPHKCPTCLKAFGLKSSVKQHFKTVHSDDKQNGNKNHHCTVCSFKCYSTTNLQLHLRIHSADLPFTCPRPGCGYRTTYKHSLPKHALQAHSDERPYKCPSDGCSYKAKTRIHIRTHLRVHSNDRPFACTVDGCTYTCKSNSGLKSHTSRVHSSEKPFKCSVCDFQTKCRSGLRPHELTHKKIKRLKCQVQNCGFTSNQTSHLKGHFDRKHRTKEVLCTQPRCNFRCGSLALLKVHLKRHELPILKCPGDSCGYRTKDNHCLLKHMTRRHSDFQSSVPVAGTSISDLKTVRTMNTLQCGFTDCRFQTKFQHLYDRHVITHKNEDKGQHVCSFCFSRFSQWRKLNEHVQRHTREKPYSCSHCSYTTMFSFQLKAHARKIHQICVIPRDKDDQVRKCRTCSKNCFSIGESVLHSMSHLQPVVVLEELKLLVL